MDKKSEKGNFDLLKKDLNNLLNGVDDNRKLSDVLKLSQTEITIFIANKIVTNIKKSVKYIVVILVLLMILLNITKPENVVLGYTGDILLAWAIYCVIVSPIFYSDWRKSQNKLSLKEE